MRRFFFILFLLSLSNAYADEECCYHFLPIYKASIGPEIYHVKRVREGGTSQHGCLYGVHGSFERLGRFKWYIGFEGLYGKGTINGHSGMGLKLKSALTDRFIEGRFGYTFQAKCHYTPSFTPFIGYGYSDETNQYKSPSPLIVKFIHESSYVSFGFLSEITLGDKFSAGFNLKMRSLVDPICKVKKDQVFGSLKMHIHEKMQYRFELPLKLAIFHECHVFEVGIISFYEIRHYGGRENYPFDFLDTKLRLFGASFQLSYRF